MAKDEPTTQEDERLSLHPLSFEQALGALLDTPPAEDADEDEVSEG